MKINLVSINRTNDFEVNPSLLVSVTPLSIEYHGTELRFDFVAEDIDHAANKLYEFSRSGVIEGNIVFDCPVVLKSKENMIEKGNENLLIWKLKKRFFEVLTFKGCIHTFQSAESIGESLKSVSDNLQ